ncbi:MAG: CoA transferase [Chloroflexi bacterium]|nr:CoA transferase [Chloroflexota bacterium]
MPDTGALQGVRVLDFTNLLAGPFPSLLCGFLGAQVIKVESRAQLDAARRTPYAQDHPDNSPAFNSINLNKLSVQLNLKESRAVELVHRLTAVSDVVVENMRPGVMDRLGLGYPQLSRINPGIIMASISAAGSTGPESSFPGYAPAFNALSGLGHMTGYADGPPGELHDSLDARVGATAAFAIMSALFHRLRTGRGQLIDLSSRESITMACAEALMDYAMNGRVAQRKGNQEEGMAPHGCYRCQGEDAWLTIAVGNDQDWEGLCRATGHPEWMSDPRFADALLRYGNRDALDGLLESWTKQYPPEQAADLLQSHGVAAATSMSGRDLLEDPHLRARGVWQEVEHPVMGVQRVPGPPWRLSETPATIRSPGPLLGQHNIWVIVDLLGESVEQVEKWVAQGVVY